MKALLKKEFMLCLHPTCFIFLAFCAFVFIPNYPYEVMFFFSGLSVFFVCLTTRENGDVPFCATLPVGKKDIATARIAFCMIFQLALVLLAGVTTAIKEIAFTPEMQVNMGGNTANLAFLGNGLLLLGLFNLVFFPLYFGAPQKVGLPFLLAGAAQFFVIALLLALRFTVPLWRDTLTAPDPAYMGAKVALFAVGVVLYAACTAGSILLSRKRFAAIDL